MATVYASELGSRHSKILWAADRAIIMGSINHLMNEIKDFGRSSDALRHGSRRQLNPRHLTMQSTFSNLYKSSSLAALVVLTVLSIISMTHWPSAPFTPGRYHRERIWLILCI